jgi:hypothetical protein
VACRVGGHYWLKPVVLTVGGRELIGSGLHLLLSASEPTYNSTSLGLRRRFFLECCLNVTDYDRRFVTVTPKRRIIRGAL